MSNWLLVQFALACALVEFPHAKSSVIWPSESFKRAMTAMGWPRTTTRWKESPASRDSSVGSIGSVPMVRVLTVAVRLSRKR